MWYFHLIADTILPRPRAYHDQLYINNRPSYGISPGMYAGLAYRPVTEPSIDAVDHDLAIIEMPDPEPGPLNISFGFMYLLSDCSFGMNFVGGFA